LNHTQVSTTAVYARLNLDPVRTPLMPMLNACWRWSIDHQNSFEVTGRRSKMHAEMRGLPGAVLGELMSLPFPLFR